ncbi:MAG: beta/gamma crystallin-related protein [Caldimonas sp.]
MNSTSLKPVLATLALLAAAHASAQITFYEGEGFRGRAFTANNPVGDFGRVGFNDRASSVVVDHGRWEVCEDARFSGRCVVLKRGSYDSLRGLGLDNRISSVRPVHDHARYDNEAPQPLAAPTYEYRQRPNERLFQAPVTSARAVVGPPEHRCWMERQQVAEPQRDINVPGGIIGGVLGGILGHQLGGGSGKTVTTIGGAVGGAALGANIDRLRDRDTGQDVRRCENTASTTPQYWDVTYNFRGVDHRIQMGGAPGPTIAVNGRGEPRQ